MQEFRGFGFVSFRSAFAAEDAAEDANGKEILGGRVKVNIAKYKSTLRPAPAHRDDRCAEQDF
jgi:RNA recognition motif-containing protein